MDTFVNEPIIVNIVELGDKFKAVKTIIFIGDVPPKIYSALKSFLTGKPIQAILKKFYSARWIEKISKLVRDDIRIIGGQNDEPEENNDDDFNFDKPLETEQESSNAKEDESETDSKEKIIDFIKEETIDITDLERLTQTQVEEIELDSDIILVTEIYAYPHDKIWDLKEKNICCCWYITYLSTYLG